MIHVIIPVLDRWQLTKACLESLNFQTYTAYQIVVIDHGSLDGTREKLGQNFPGVKVVYGNRNMWWTAATNLGVEYILDVAVDSDFILTLNNDLVVSADYLENLIACATFRDNLLVGSISKDILSQQIQFAGVKWNSITAKYVPSESYATAKETGPPFSETDLLPGRGTLIPVHAFRRVGLYDEINFPHYAADEDFSLRCKRAGYELVVAANAIVLSHTGASGDHVVTKPGTRQIWKLLTSIKSPSNLKKRWLWAKKHSPVPIVYFLFDSSRIFLSIVKRVLRTSNTLD